MNTDTFDTVSPNQRGIRVIPFWVRRKREAQERARYKRYYSLILQMDEMQSVYIDELAGMPEGTAARLAEQLRKHGITEAEFVDANVKP